jgi:hypothetical protein
MKDEALKLALEALEEWYFGCGAGSESHDDAVEAIKQALAAPVKDNSNYRLDPPGLDPAGGTQVSKVWWDGDKLIAKPIPFVEFYKAAPDLQAELDATNRQVEILNDALAESRREVAALKAVQEPVFELQKSGWEIICDLDWIQTLPFGTLLYTTPPAAQRQWVGLTLADREKLRDQFEGWNYPAILVDAVSDILKEKNT